MTEGKRTSIPGNKATMSNKVGGSLKDMTDVKDDFFKAVGARIKVTVAPRNIAYEGLLFAASPEMNAIAINIAPAASGASGYDSSQQTDFHIIPTCHLLSFQLVPKGEAGHGLDNAQPSLERLDLAILKQREQIAIRKLKDKDAHKGRGVGKEGQEIFDALARTLPCRWHETTIIANESVMIKPPYRIDDLQAPKDKQQSLVHVRKIMEGYLARKGKTGSGAANKAPVATPMPPRKGG